MNNCIEYINGDDTDIIDLTEEEQEIIWNILDKQCRETLGKNCENLLKEAKAQIA